MRHVENIVVRIYAEVGTHSGHSKEHARCKPEKQNEQEGDDRQHRAKNLVEDGPRGSTRLNAEGFQKNNGRLQ